MSSWFKRTITIVAAAAVGGLGHAVPVLAPYTSVAAAWLVGWAVKHPADAAAKGALR